MPYSCVNSVSPANDRLARVGRVHVGHHWRALNTSSCAFTLFLLSTIGRLGKVVSLETSTSEIRRPFLLSFGVHRPQLEEHVHTGKGNTLPTSKSHQTELRVSGENCTQVICDQLSSGARLFLTSSLTALSCDFQSMALLSTYRIPVITLISPSLLDQSSNGDLMTSLMTLPFFTASDLGNLISEPSLKAATKLFPSHRIAVLADHTGDKLGEGVESHVACFIQGIDYRHSKIHALNSLRQCRPEVIVILSRKLSSRISFMEKVHCLLPLVDNVWIMEIVEEAWSQTVHKVTEDLTNRLMSQIKGTPISTSCTRQPSKQWLQEQHRLQKSLLIPNQLTGLSYELQMTSTILSGPKSHDVAKIIGGRLSQIGIWNSVHGFTWLPMQSEVVDKDVHKPFDSKPPLDRDVPLHMLHARKRHSMSPCPITGLPSLKGAKLRVTTLLEKPFIMMENSTDGSSRYFGFCIDLLDALSEQLQFNYSLHRVVDGQYGVKRPDGNWTGMVGELINCDADLAVAPLTITSSRSHVISFSSAFMQFGLQMLMLKSSSLPTDFWSFLTPLHWSVWLLLIVSFLMLSASFTIVNHLSPKSYRNARRLRGEPKLKKTDCAIDEFSLYNSVWFMAASFTQQGSDKQPLSPSGRLIGFTWYMFSLLMINMYIANLAAVFTNTTTKTKISDVTSLPFQTDFSYGTVMGSQPHVFFNTSTIPAYQRVWSGMDLNFGSNMVPSSAAGVEKAKLSQYVFIWESPALHYISHRQPCSLKVVGNPFDLQSYGFGLPLNAAWESELSQAILRLREDGTVSRLEHKWWAEQSQCAESSRETSATGETINLDQVGGIVLILVGGTAVGLLVLVWEIKTHVCKVAVEEKVSVQEALVRWLRDCRRKLQVPCRKGTRTLSAQEIKHKATEHAGQNCCKVGTACAVGRLAKTFSPLAGQTEFITAPLPKQLA